MRLRHGEPDPRPAPEEAYQVVDPVDTSAVQP